MTLMIGMNTLGFMQEDKYNCFLSDEELNTVLPSTGYSIVTPPPGYALMTAPCRLMATPIIEIGGFPQRLLVLHT